MKAKCQICGRKVTVEDGRWLSGHPTVRIVRDGQTAKTCAGSGKMIKR